MHSPSFPWCKCLLIGLGLLAIALGWTELSRQCFQETSVYRVRLVEASQVAVGIAMALVGVYATLYAAEVVSSVQQRKERVCSQIDSMIRVTDEFFPALQSFVKSPQGTGSHKLNIVTIFQEFKRLRTSFNRIQDLLPEERKLGDLVRSLTRLETTVTDCRDFDERRLDQLQYPPPIIDRVSEATADIDDILRSVHKDLRTKGLSS